MESGDVSNLLDYPKCSERNRRVLRGTFLQGRWKPADIYQINSNDLWAPKVTEYSLLQRDWTPSYRQYIQYIELYSVTFMWVSIVVWNALWHSNCSPGAWMFHLSLPGSLGILNIQHCWSPNSVSWIVFHSTHHSKIPSNRNLDLRTLFKYLLQL